MKLYGECEIPGCRRLGFFVRKRHNKIHGSWTTSRTRMCSRCARAIRNMLK